MDPIHLRCSMFIFFTHSKFIRSTPEKIGSAPINHDTRQDGSALVLSLLILSVLTMVGLLAARTTTTEVRMATHDMRHKLAFYTAEGVAELVSEVLEQRLACPDGPAAGIGSSGLVQAETDDFWRNKRDAGRLPTDDNGSGTPVRDLRVPAGGSDEEPHTNIVVGGTTKLSVGNGLQTASGYEGNGRSLAVSGAQIVYDEIIQHVGPFNSEALIKIQWRHVIGREGRCSN